MNISFSTHQLVADITAHIENAKEAMHIASQGTMWDEVFTPLDRALSALNTASSKYSHLVAVNYSDELNAEYEKTIPLLSSFYSELGTNTSLYTAYKNLTNTALSAEQQHILNDTLLGFELSGIHLEGEMQERFIALEEELSILSNTFAKNSLQATTEYKYQVSSEELAGVPEHDRELLKGEDGGYYLSLNHPNYVAVMTYCSITATRERLYKAYISRASHLDGFDNLQTLQDILTKRRELATLLGYANYAEYSLASKMVQSPEEVESFILELIHKCRSSASSELEELEQFAGKELQPWDYWYYSEQLKQQTFGIDSEQLKQYFPFERVLAGVLLIINKLYSLEYNISEVTHYGQLLRVITFTQDENIVGELLLDPFAREHKRSGAWMSDYQELDTKIQQTPIAFVVCNASRPTSEVPSLLTFDDVVTLFHEFGHALHHVLTKSEYPSVAGISGVPWDGVELPSQYMEFFAYEPENIKQLSQHYLTGEALSDEQIKSIIRAKNFHAALMTLRQCEFALWDIRTHMSTDDTYTVLAQVRELTALLPSVEHNYFLNSFGHIFAGGYAAGYYSYKWAEVMSADAYQRVSTEPEKAKEFLKHILQIGGTKDFLSSYLVFSGGEQPSIDALLTMSGIHYEH